MIEFLTITMHVTGLLLMVLFIGAILSGMISLLIDPTVLICTFLCALFLTSCMI